MISAAERYERVREILIAVNAVPKLVNTFFQQVDIIAAGLGDLEPGENIPPEFFERFKSMQTILPGIEAVVNLLNCIQDREIRVIVAKVMTGTPWKELSVNGQPAINAATDYLIKHLEEIDLIYMQSLEKGRT